MTLHDTVFFLFSNDCVKCKRCDFIYQQQQQRHHNCHRIIFWIKYIFVAGNDSRKILFMRMHINIYLFQTDKRLGEAKCHSQHINVLTMNQAWEPQENIVFTASIAWWNTESMKRRPEYEYTQLKLCECVIKTGTREAAACCVRPKKIK